MKEETKQIIKKVIILFSPVFSLIMLVLPWSSIFNWKFRGATITEYKNYIELFSESLAVFTKILLGIVLLGIFASLVLYILGLIIKDKEKILSKIASIILVSCSAFLLFFPIIKTTSNEATRWVSFITFPYGLMLVYNVYVAYLVNKKESIK